MKILLKTISSSLNSLGGNFGTSISGKYLFDQGDLHESPSVLYSDLMKSPNESSLQIDIGFSVFCLNSENKSGFFIIKFEISEKK